jgi:hypothetical protein
MTRTTLDIDPTVLAQLRERAAAERKSMGQLVSEGLARDFGKEPASELPPLNWVRKDMGPFKIDIEDKDALWQLLDGDSYDVRDKP